MIKCIYAKWFIVKICWQKARCASNIEAEDFNISGETKKKTIEKVYKQTVRAKFVFLSENTSKIRVKSVVIYVIWSMF